MSVAVNEALAVVGWLKRVPGKSNDGDRLNEVVTSSSSYSYRAGRLSSLLLVIQTLATVHCTEVEEGLRPIWAEK